MQVNLPGEILLENQQLEFKSNNFNRINQNQSNEENPIPQKGDLLVSKVSGILIPKIKSETQTLKFIQITEKYIPSQEDRIVGRILRKTADSYEVDIRADRKALLGILSFQGANKKSKPNLSEGDLVFARLQTVPQFLLYKLNCTSQSNIKAWNSGESLFGNLNAGIEVRIPIFFSRFLNKDELFFEIIRKYVSIEVAVGINGVLWFKTGSIKNQLILSHFFTQAPFLLKQKATELLQAEIANFG